MTPTHRTRRDLTLLSGYRLPAGSPVRVRRVRSDGRVEFAVAEDLGNVTAAHLMAVDMADLEPITPKEPTE